MICSLVCHPETPTEAVSAVEVEIARSEYGQLCLRYLVTGLIDRIVIPPPVRYGSRSDGLWKTTCFESFVKTATSGYFEFNFSPSTAWAAYRFSSYREGMIEADLDPPHFDVELSDQGLEIFLAADVSQLEGLDAKASWTLALSAVIEEIDGTKSYWALKHPPGPPDFHHPDCFALTLPAPE